MLSLLPSLWPALQAFCMLIAFAVFIPTARTVRVIVNRSPRRTN